MIKPKNKITCTYGGVWALDSDEGRRKRVGSGDVLTQSDLDSSRCCACYKKLPNQAMLTLCTTKFVIQSSIEDHLVADLFDPKRPFSNIATSPGGEGESELQRSIRGSAASERASRKDGSTRDNSHDSNSESYSQYQRCGLFCTVSSSATEPERQFYACPHTTRYAVFLPSPT